MTYSRRTLASSTGAEDRQASAAAMRFRSIAAARGVCRIGMTAVASAACASRRRPIPAKKASAFFSESPATCSAIAASTISITDAIEASHGGGRSYSKTLNCPSPGFTLTSLSGVTNHGQARPANVNRRIAFGVAMRHSVAVIGTSNASCAPVTFNGCAV